MANNEIDGVKVATVGCLGVLLGALLLGGCAAGKRVRVSDGFRDGVVQKLSCRGVAVRTWEGELVLDRVKYRADQNGGTGGTVVFEFSVPDPAVAAELEAVPPGEAVRLHYEQRLTTTPLDYESRYRVVRVERLGKRPAGG